MRLYDSAVSTIAIAWQTQDLGERNRYYDNAWSWLLALAQGFLKPHDLSRIDMTPPEPMPVVGPEVTHAQRRLLLAEYTERKRRHVERVMAAMKTVLDEAGWMQNDMRPDPGWDQAAEALKGGPYED